MIDEPAGSCGSSGAIYTLVPDDVRKVLGVVPKWTVTFTLADGTRVDRPVSEFHITSRQGDGHARHRR